MPQVKPGKQDHGGESPKRSDAIIAQGRFDTVVERGQVP